MTKQLQVLLAVKALVQAALPTAKILGFNQDSELPERIGDDGTVVGFPGDPGEPEVDLSPPAYNYRHVIPLEIARQQGSTSAALDAMFEAIGAGVAADRTLGGLCNYLDVEAASLENSTGDMVSSINWAGCAIVAEYSCSNPLG